METSPGVQPIEAPPLPVEVKVLEVVVAETKDDELESALETAELALTFEKETPLDELRLLVVSVTSVEQAATKSLR